MVRSTRRVTGAIAAVLFGCLCVSGSCGLMNRAHVFVPRPASKVGMAESAVDTLIQDRLIVSVRFEALDPKKKAAPRTVRLRVPGDTTLTVRLVRADMRERGSYTWFGNVLGQDGSSATLVVADNILAGTIRLPDALYRVQYIGEGLHAVLKLDAHVLPPEAPPLELAPPKPMPLPNVEKSTP